MFVPKLPQREPPNALTDLMLSVARSGLPQDVKDKTKELIATAASGSTPVPGGTGLGVSNMPTYLDPGELLQGFFYDGRETDRTMATRVFYDIYHFDAVCGPCTDLLAVAPTLGGFTLEAGDTQGNELDVFEENLAQLNLIRNIPRLEVEKFVAGRSASYLLVDEESKNLQDIVTLHPRDVTVKPTPFSNLQPIVKGRLHELALTGLAYMQAEQPELYAVLKARFTETLLESLRGEVTVPSQALLFLQNDMHPQSFGVSLYRRVLPYWFYEKNLFRGTLQESIRRQRAVSHMTLGNEDWMPLPEDFQKYIAGLQQAAADPIGAVFATYPGVEISDIMEGGQFWKWDDVAATTLPYKIRAMGLPESLANMDGSFGVETGVNSVIDLFKTRRAYIEHAVFETKLLPLIAILKGFRKDSLSSDVTELLDMDGRDTAMSAYMAVYGPRCRSHLRLPTLKWNRPLNPPVDATAVSDLLDKATAAGLPIPLRTVAAALNMDVDALIRSREQDLTDRKAAKDYMDAIHKINPPPDDGSGGGGGGWDAGAAPGFSRLARPTPRQLQALAKQAARQNHERTQLRAGDLNYDGDGHLFVADHSGKPKLVHNQTEFDRKANAKIARCAAFNRIRGK